MFCEICLKETNFLVPYGKTKICGQCYLKLDSQKVNEKSLEKLKRKALFETQNIINKKR